MLRVQFNGNKSMQQVDFKLISPEQVELRGEKLPCSDKGFKIYRLNGSFLGDYSAYTVAEEAEEGCVRYSKP